MVRLRIRAKPRPLSGGDKFVLGLTDPLGALNRGANRLFGIDENDGHNLLLGLGPVREIDFTPVAGTPLQRRRTGAVDGFRLTFEYRWE